MNEEIQGIEQAKEHNREKLLKMFNDKKTLTNKEILKAGIGRFGDTIRSLRLEGYVINKKYVAESDGVYEYTIVKKGDPIKQLPAIETLTEKLIEKGFFDVAEQLSEILNEARVTVRNKPIF